MKPNPEKFLEEVMRMNPDTVNPTESMMFRVCLEVLQKWENYRILFGSESEKP